MLFYSMPSLIEIMFQVIIHVFQSVVIMAWCLSETCEKIMEVFFFFRIIELLSNFARKKERGISKIIPYYDFIAQH